MSKPFKTFNEQIDILEKRGLIVDNREEAVNILARVNYYNIINGYKSIFLERDLKGKIIQPERFKENINFKQIYNLYKFDNNIKSILFKYLLQFERELKTLCAYHYSEEFQTDYAYLQMSNYSNDENDMEVVLKNLAFLSNHINEKVKINGAIKHHKNKHGNVPLWVLINSLTFGNVIYFYKSLSESLKDNIARVFGERFKNDYSSNEKLDVVVLIEILRISNYYRNIIAHNESIFLFQLRKRTKIALFKKFWDYKYKGKNLFDLLMAIRLVLPIEEYKALYKEMDNTINEYKDKFTVVDISEILQLVGFPEEWEKHFDIFNREKDD